MSVRRKIALLTVMLLVMLGAFLAIGARVMDTHITRMLLEDARETLFFRAMELRDRPEKAGEILRKASRYLLQGTDGPNRAQMAALFTPYLQDAPESALVVFTDAGRFHYLDLHKKIRISRFDPQCITDACLSIVNMNTGAPAQISQTAASSFSASIPPLIEHIKKQTQARLQPDFFLLTDTKGLPRFIASTRSHRFAEQTMIVTALYTPADFARYLVADRLDTQSFLALLFTDQHLVAAQHTPQDKGVSFLTAQELPGKKTLGLTDFSQARNNAFYSPPGSGLWMEHVLSTEHEAISIYVLSGLRPFFRVVYEDSRFLTIILCFIATVLGFAAYLFLTPGKKAAMQNISDCVVDEYIVRSTIAKGEGQQVEFKSSLRKNLRTGKYDKNIELACMKSLSAFLNATGGLLLTGVDDTGTIVGMEHDEFTSTDHTLRHARNLMNEHIGVQHAQHLRTTLLSIEDKTVLVIQAASADSPVFLTESKEKDAYYVRTGPANKRLTFAQFYERIRSGKNASDT